MSHLYQFDKSEKKIRDNWLVASALIQIVWPFSSILPFLFTSLLQKRTLDFLHSPLPFAINGIVVFALLYHFAYKKHGTKLLGTWLFLSTFIQVYFTVAWLTLQHPLGIHIGKQRPETMVFFGLLELGGFVWCFIASLRMYALNAGLKKAQD